MSNADPLLARFPGLDSRLHRVRLATLPTPVREASIRVGASTRTVWIKEDNLTGVPYGGNKVRKLEFLFGRLQYRQRRRVATFGAVGSNHALATALYARRLGIDPICLLSHQTRTPLAAQTLNMHVTNRSEIVRLGGDYRMRMRTLRDSLWNRDVDVIPLGGSSWIGTLGSLNAGLELADQIAAGTLPQPKRIYIAAGTMGTAAGIALGLALAGLEIEVHAVRVSHSSIANERVLGRLLAKTVCMLNRMETKFPSSLAKQARLLLRHEFFAPGYAHSNDETNAAIRLAADQLGLSLEPTYTGKAMAALLADLAQAGEPILYWNTYHSAPLPADTERPPDVSGLPEEFLSYFD